MRTIGRRFAGERGDFPARCDYCGTPWYRSSLRRDESGLLVCPQEGDGLDAVALSEGNAMGAADYLGPGNNDAGGVPPHVVEEIAPDIALSLQGGENP